MNHRALCLEPLSGKGLATRWVQSDSPLICNKSLRVLWNTPAVTSHITEDFQKR
jgi:hypothetical protein